MMQCTRRICSIDLPPLPHVGEGWGEGMRTAHHYQNHSCLGSIYLSQSTKQHIKHTYHLSRSTCRNALPFALRYTSKYESIVSTWAILRLAASSATDTSARSNGKLRKRSLISSTNANVSGNSSAVGASSVNPPRWHQRKKSSALSLFTRLASSAHTSVSTGHVVKRLACGLARSHCITGGCQRSARLNKASSGPLSATTCRMAGSTAVPATTPTTCLSLATPGFGSLHGALVVPNLYQCSLALAGQGYRATATAKQVFTQLVSRRRMRCVERQVSRQRIPHQCTGSAALAGTAATQRTLKGRIKFDGHGHFCSLLKVIPCLLRRCHTGDQFAYQPFSLTNLRKRHDTTRTE